jgi:glycopeptide antibiotics resistance protein
VTLTTALRVLAWLLLAGLIFVTLSPINLRPISPLPTQVERAIAVMLVGFVFALAYPRRFVLVAAIVLGATALLEVLQLVTPSRHGGVTDVAVKLLGGSLGLVGGWLVNRVRPH